MRLSEYDMSLLIQIIFEWDRWITMDGMETDIGGKEMVEVKKLFRKIYNQYWYGEKSGIEV